MELYVIFVGCIGTILLIKSICMYDILTEITLSDLSNNLARGLGARQKHRNQANKFLMAEIIIICLTGFLYWILL